MPLRSPFEGLQVDKELVCEFFAFFSRLEFAIKELGFIRHGQNFATPAWRRFAQEASTNLQIADGSEAAAAVAYLNANPPMVQNSLLVWETLALEGNNPIGKRPTGYWIGEIPIC